MKAGPRMSRETEARVEPGDAVRVRLTFETTVALPPELQRHRRLLVSVPTGLHLVATFEQHLRERFAPVTAEPQPWALAVDNFALPRGQPLHGVLRDGDTLTVSEAFAERGAPAERAQHSLARPGPGKPSPPCGTTSTAAAAGLRVEAPPAARAEALLAEEPKAPKRRKQEKEDKQAGSKAAFAEAPPAAEPERPRKQAADAEAASAPQAARPRQQAGAGIGEMGRATLADTKGGQRTDVKAKAQAGAAAGPGGGAQRRETHGSDGQSSDFWHPILGALELPEGEDRDSFINRKLKTLRKAVRRQVEHYFGEKNWASDEHLRKLADEHGFVDFSSIAEFERLHCLTADIAVMRESVQDSPMIEVSPCGLRLRRRL